MEYTKIPKDGVYKHMYCYDKHCRGDTLHAVQFRWTKDNYVYFAKMCMACYTRIESAKKFTDDVTPASIDFLSFEKWNELIKFG